MLAFKQRTAFFAGLVFNPSLSFVCCLTIMFAPSHLAYAVDNESISATEAKAKTAAVRFVETDESTCLVNDGKLVSIELVDHTQTYEVWVDRWYMQVQTADHTKQILSPTNPMVELGCTRTYSGPQHWTIYSVKQMP